MTEGVGEQPGYVHLGDAHLLLPQWPVREPLGPRGGRAFEVRSPPRRSADDRLRDLAC
jgi:hypothetical protein